MSKVTYVSFADTALGEVPWHLWKFMPSIQTVDLGRTRIKEILYNSFQASKHTVILSAWYNCKIASNILQGLPDLKTLVLPGNQISRIDKNAIPLHVQRLHIGRNRISDLNGTIYGKFLQFVGVRVIISSSTF